MPLSFRERVRTFIASPLPEAVTLAVAGIFAYLGSGVSLVIVVVAVLLGIILIIIARYTLTYKPILDYRETQLTNFFNEHLSMIESDIEDFRDNQIEVRANIMLVSSGIRKDDTVGIEYVADQADYRRGELELEFGIGQGCAGMVIEDNDPKVAESPPQASSWGDSWGTNAEQDQATSHLCTIIGAPIYDPQDSDQSNPIGVFIIDSENPIHEVFDEPQDTIWEDYDFGGTDLVTRAAEHAKNVGILV